MKLTSHTCVLALLAAAACVPCLSHAGNILISEDPSNVTISGNDYEFSLQANGQNIDTNFGGTPLSVSLGTPINFSGQIIDNGATTAGTQEIYVLPFAGANYATSDLNFSNSATDGNSYTVNGTYNSLENVTFPFGATTVVAGNSIHFDAPFSSNILGTTAAVPEPSTWALLGIGLAAVGMACRRQHLTGRPV